MPKPTLFDALRGAAQPSPTQAAPALPPPGGVRAGLSPYDQFVQDNPGIPEVARKGAFENFMNHPRPAAPTPQPAAPAPAPDPYQNFADYATNRQKR